MTTAELFTTINAICPITDVQITGTPENPAYSISFDPSSTFDQRCDAQNALMKIKEIPTP
jgi:hypothetical protein